MVNGEKVFWPITEIKELEVPRDVEWVKGGFNDRGNMNLLSI